MFPLSTQPRETARPLLTPHLKTLIMDANLVINYTRGILAVKTETTVIWHCVLHPTVVCVAFANTAELPRATRTRHVRWEQSCCCMCTLIWRYETEDVQGYTLISVTVPVTWLVFSRHNAVPVETSVSKAIQSSWSISDERRMTSRQKIHLFFSLLTMSVIK